MESPEIQPYELGEQLQWRSEIADWGVLHRLYHQSTEVGHVQAFVGSLYKVHRLRTDRPSELIAVVKTSLEDAKIILEDATWEGLATPATPPQHFCAPLLEGSRAYNRLFSYPYADPLTITKSETWKLFSGSIPHLVDITYCPFCGEALE